MVNEELRESVVEFFAILENTDEEILNKIPKKFLEFLESIKSETYTFKYDYKKKLMDQNIKPKTKGLIALVYQDYICTPEEKKEYIQLCNDYFLEEETRKNNTYTQDIFKRNVEEKIAEVKPEINIDEKIEEVKSEPPENKVETALIKYDENIFKKFLNKIKSFFQK